MLTALLGSLPVVAQAATPTESGRIVSIEPVDLETKTWFDFITGEALDIEFVLETIENRTRESRPTEISPLFQASPFAPFLIEKCTTTNFKVIYRQWADPTNIAVCFGGGGVTIVPLDIRSNTEVVIGVCPGNKKGQIHYRAANNWRWSEMRGPQTTNTNCYLFASQSPPVFPDQFDEMAFESPTR